MTEAKRPRVPREKAQEIIMKAAEELFYQEGIHAVSVDAIVERAGMNKMSVYRQFSSKTDLILAYMTRKQDAFWQEWEESIAKHPNRPREQLIQFFADLAERATNEQFRGCCFINVAAEFPDPVHPVRELVCSHQKRIRDAFLDRTTALGAAHPCELAYTLILLMEGTYADSQTYGTDSAAIRMVPAIVEKVLDQALHN
ncbi:TetR/AcrR family transcriptional regulator [Brevibacillus formosus]|uniref:TetR family transcriptional regulator n=1 Tax=Brevibacillus formosus TaxID=54913 RepID=A0A837KTT3_9BACL|nr:TetR/AcrR family transcriptional regulator [Brevibacillus formosus]KLI01219.1 TetR family transcriptional regulator [Brevibacillus formosus]MED1955757.1 TetR/AcrR family transcriptional regulator [Brevibacillus formosus]PSK00098.1 TetR/AcrR family transcriptional regulator [Brevibacillus formosus]GED59146.1 TetR family transcriptional regulator [Brevibacillus formosus]